MERKCLYGQKGMGPGALSACSSHRAKSDGTNARAIDLATDRRATSWETGVAAFLCAGHMESTVHSLHNSRNLSVRRTGSAPLDNHNNNNDNNILGKAAGHDRRQRLSVECWSHRICRGGCSHFSRGKLSARGKAHLAKPPHQPPDHGPLARPPSPYTVNGRYLMWEVT